MILQRIISTLLIFASFSITTVYGKEGTTSLSVNFYGDTLQIQSPVDVLQKDQEILSEEFITNYYSGLKEAGYVAVAQNLLRYKKEHHLDDWLYYQLIRTVAGAISSKAANYHKYTLFKWFLLRQSGYDATISFCNNKLLLYIQTDEEIFEVPFHTRDNKQYVCLNYHDYGTIDLIR